MIHSKECREATKKRNREMAAWVKRYPNYCRECDGRGLLHSTFDPSPSGVSLSAGSMDDVDVCEFCTGERICPRCGSENALDEDGNGPCAVCDFNFNDGCPEAWECCCYEDEPYLSAYTDALGGT